MHFSREGFKFPFSSSSGYDDQGRRFDATGNLADWWTPEDAEEFKRRAKVIVDQFSGYAVHGAQLNGELTQGENIADLGGVKIAYAAFQRAQVGLCSI